MTTDEELLRDARPAWMKQAAAPPFEPSKDWPMSPLLQKRPPILTTESVNLGLGSGSGDGGALNADTIEIVVPVNGTFAVVEVYRT
jgi:hypothetical protein